jgi:hypothetical protein
MSSTRTLARRSFSPPHEYRTLKAKLPEELVVFDRAYVDARQPSDVIAAIFRQRGLVGEVSCFPERFSPSMLDDFPVEESDAKCKIPTQEWFDENYFSTKNESFPTESALVVNGMDEHYDLGRGPGDPDLCRRLRRTGLPLWIANEAIVHCLNPRGILPNMNVVIPEDRPLPPPYNKRWVHGGWVRVRRSLEAPHSPRAPNPFDIRALREELWHWRELSQSPSVENPEACFF